MTGETACPTRDIIHSLQVMKRALLFLLLTPVLGLAQLVTAELGGRITDQTGAIIPGARVTLRNTATS